MSTEKAAGVTRRAAKHAALADPGRLLIVDQLILRDASPSELQRCLGMSSNLLAHHLKVLEAEGIVVRNRSQGDRRRTYLRVVPAAFTGMVPGAPGQPASRVVFVCTANSARSQLAEALWHRASSVAVASAGTHPATRIDPGAVAVARRHGLSLRIRRPRAIRDVLAKDDLVVTVCDSAHEEMSAPGALHWSVPDPVPAGTDSSFEAAFKELTERVTDLAQRITPLPNGEES